MLCMTLAVHRSASQHTAEQGILRMRGKHEVSWTGTRLAEKLVWSGHSCPLFLTVVLAFCGTRTPRRTAPETPLRGTIFPCRSRTQAPPRKPCNSTFIARCRESSGSFWLSRCVSSDANSIAHAYAASIQNGRKRKLLANSSGSLSFPSRYLLAFDESACLPCGRYFRYPERRWNYISPLSRKRSLRRSPAGKAPTLNDW
jgi:hypothetical protein